MKQTLRFSLVMVLALLVSDASTLAQRRGGGGGARGGGGTRNARSSARTSTRNNNTNVNRNRNVNRNTNIDIDRDVDINVNRRGYGGCCYSSGWGTAAAVATTAIVTAAVVGSRVNTLPPSCTVIISNGFTYQQCGNVYYQPQLSGGSTTYVVVNAP